jgi:hypothetical protein
MHRRLPQKQHIYMSASQPALGIGVTVPDGGDCHEDGDGIPYVVITGMTITTVKLLLLHAADAYP